MLQLKMFENEGAIFRGYHRHSPLEVWDRRQQIWKPYGGRVPKPVEWGTEIAAVDAAPFMRPR